MFVLFEDKQRDSLDLKSYIETEWDYLDRSGRVEAQRVRKFLSYWVSEYPELHRDELISRIRSSDDRNFQSATFELILFALLRSLGCSVTVHPDLPNGIAAHPDFHVITPTGEPAYVEGVLASEFNEREISARKRTDAVLHAIEKMDSPNFFLGITAEGHPEQPPKGKRLRKQLEQWLSSLDPDAVIREVAKRGHNAVPRSRYQYGNWDIVFEAIPKKPERRGKGQKVIGVLSNGAHCINEWEPIRDSVKFKGNRYGNLPHSLLVALNVDSFSVDRFDEMQALYGQEEYVFNSANPSGVPRRKPNGAWFGPKGPQYKRVSGAWIFCGLNPWNIVSRRNTIYFNPWAFRQLPSVLMNLPHAKAERDRMQWVDGQSLGDILGLSAEWPE